MDTSWGEIVAYNLSNLNKFKKQSGMIEENVLFYYEKKIATQFLKTGDLVEVDANKGVVKKIES